MNNESINAYLVDDEELALKRLEYLLKETGRVEVVGMSTEPEKAVEWLLETAPDVLFLDIKMPGLTGFELLERLDSHPPVIFTTAFDEHSLSAFEYFSVDYLLKPIKRKRLNAALDKLERILPSDVRNIADLIRRLKDKKDDPGFLKRISSRVGSKVQIIDIKDITHFVSEDRTTFAVTAKGERRPLDLTLNGLEKSLDLKRFMRIHRSTIINLDFVKEVHGWFAGGVMIRLKDPCETDLSVARSRVRELKSRLGMNL